MSAMKNVQRLLLEYSIAKGTKYTGLKIKNHSKEHGTEILKLLFEIGFTWPGKGKEITHTERFGFGAFVYDAWEEPTLQWCTEDQFYGVAPFADSRYGKCIWVTVKDLYRFLGREVENEIKAQPKTSFDGAW